MPVENLTRTYRRANETGLSGSEAITVDVGQDLDQTISASTEEEVTASLTAHTLQSLCMLCDQAVTVQVLETRFAILQTVQGPPGTITHTGDLEQEIYGGDLVRVEGTVADDGVYFVDTVSEGAGTTTITLANGQSFPVGGGGAVGTVARVASVQSIGYSYDIATATLATGVITVTGNITDKVAAGDLVVIQGSTGNDGIWDVDTVTEAAGTTSITLNGGTLPDNTNDGDVYVIRHSFELAADTPWMWSVDSGIQNPFIHAIQTVGMPPIWGADRGAIVAFMVDNTGNTVTADFDARIGTNSDIF